MKALSVNQMQKLKELGIDTSKASMCWLKDKNDRCWLNTYTPPCYNGKHLKQVPTFTSQDIIELLPHEVTDYADYQLLINKQRDSYSVSYENTDSFLVSFCRVELLDCLYEMLLWVIDNNYLETK